jgi:decaprenylphospho-beta-D-erythro-pentofuranosid-2-ulose 2-reductase
MAWALILGATSDIARATARKFAAEGFDLYLASRNPLAMEGDVGDLFVRYGIRAVAVEFDALEYAGHKKFYASLSEKPEVVFCAVGYMGSQEVAQKDFAEAWRIMETNYLGCVSILNAAAEDLEQRGSGDIICVSSAAGDRGRKSNYIYGSSKAGLTQYLSGLRNRLASTGVRVMTVIPGFVDTRMTEAMDLPRALMATPAQVAEDVVNGWKKRKDVLYTRWFWRYIMLVIKHIPEFIFKKLNL